MYYAQLSDIGVLVHDVFRHDLRHGPSRTLERRGRTQHGMAPRPPLRGSWPSAPCGHGSNHVTALAYSVNHANTGDWRCGRRRGRARSCIARRLRRPQGRRGRGRARSHKKAERRRSSHGSYWIPEGKKVGNFFSRTPVCVIHLLSRRTRAPLARQAAGEMERRNDVSLTTGNASWRRNGFFYLDSP
jgi:hypothetical protein